MYCVVKYRTKCTGNENHVHGLCVCVVVMCTACVYACVRAGMREFKYVYNKV